MITARAWSTIRSGSSCGWARAASPPPTATSSALAQPIGSAGLPADPCWSVTRRAPGVRDPGPDGQELPVVVHRVEGQPEDAPDAALAEFAVRDLGLEGAQLGPARPGDDLADPAGPLFVAG